MRLFESSGPPTILVCGTGRCGTAYMAQMLTDLEIPCGHQKVFSPELDPEVGLRIRKRTPWAESSPAAIPILAKVPKEVYCVHLTRHPLLVLASIYRSRFFEKPQNDIYYRFAEDVLPGLRHERTPLARAARFVVGGNRRIAMALDQRGLGSKHDRQKIENLSSSDGLAVHGLLGIAGVHVALELVRAVVSELPGDYGTDGATASLNQATEFLQYLPVTLRNELETTIDDYGYREDSL